MPRTHENAGSNPAVPTDVRGACTVEVPVIPPTPWKQDAGYLRDEPLYEQWREAMEEYRSQLDEDSEAL